METKQEIVEDIVSVLKKFPYILKAELFGSVARGDFGEESDVDLIIFFDENETPRGLARYEILESLNKVLCRDVHITEEDILHDFVRDAIAGERETIYFKLTSDGASGT